MRRQKAVKRKAAVPAQGRRKRRAAKKGPAKAPSQSDFSRLVLQFEASGLDHEAARVKASGAYAEMLRNFDRVNPAGIKALFRAGSFDTLYLRHLSKYFPLVAESEIRQVAETVFEAERARKLLENPSISTTQKGKLKAKIFELKVALQRPELLSKEDRLHAEQSMHFIRQKLLNPQLSEQQVVFNRFVAENKGALFARNKLTTAGLRLASYMGSNVFNRKRGICGLAGMTLGDCIQEANLGMIDAARKFRPDMKVRFSTYASQRARGQVLETLRDRAMLMKLPRKVQKQIESEAAFSKARTEYYEKIGSAPTQKVRQKALQNLGDLARARAAMRLGSGDKDIGTGQGKAITRFDIEPSRNALDPARTAENADLKKKLAQIISNMPGNTGRVLQLRFLSDQAPMSMKEASAVMGLDESRASQLQTQAIELLLIRRPNMLQDLGFEATARKALPTKADVAEVSRRLNQIFIESRPTKNKKQHKTISGRA